MGTLEMLRLLIHSIKGTKFSLNLYGQRKDLLPKKSRKKTDGAITHLTTARSSQSQEVTKTIDVNKMPMVNVLLVTKKTTISRGRRKEFFIPKFEGLKLDQTNVLDLWNLDSPCLIKGPAELVSYEMEKGVINIELKRKFTFVKDYYSCIGVSGITELKQTAFEASFYYSLVKLDKLASQAYKAVPYPTHDHSEFGFFKDYNEELGIDNDTSRKKGEYLLNRWMPGKSDEEPRKIKYYLSDSFFKPSNAKILEATKKAQNHNERCS